MGIYWFAKHNGRVVSYHSPQCRCMFTEPRIDNLQDWGNAANLEDKTVSYCSVLLIGCILADVQGVYRLGLGKYPLLFAETGVNNCFNMYQTSK